MIIQHFKSEDIQKNVESKTKNKLRMKHYSEICKIACKYFDLNSNEQTERLIETMYKQHVPDLERIYLSKSEKMKRLRIQAFQIGNEIN